MELTTDEAKIVIEMILDNLDEVGHFVFFLETIKSEPPSVEALIELSQKVSSNLAIGKATIARMLINKDESVKPDAEGMEVLERWERIEDEILGGKANDS